MKDKQHLYQQWLAHRKQITVPDTFSKDVMGAIDQASIQKSEINNLELLQERLQRPVYQWMAASGLVLLGLFRIVYVAGTLVRTNLVMP